MNRRFSLCLLAALAVLAGCSKPVPVRSYPMGERVQLGNLVYNVFETQWLPQLGEAATARVPTNRFLLIRLSAANAGPEDVNVPALTLENSKGNVYNEVSGGDDVPQWLGLLRKVKPAEAAQGNVLFDVPPGAYKLRISDENGEGTAFIDLPLSFHTEAPDLALPAAPEEKQ